MAKSLRRIKDELWLGTVFLGQGAGVSLALSATDDDFWLSVSAALLLFWGVDVLALTVFLFKEERKDD